MSNEKIEQEMTTKREKLERLEDQLYGGGLERSVRESLYKEYRKVSMDYTNLQVFVNMFSAERA